MLGLKRGKGKGYRVLDEGLDEMVGRGDERRDRKIISKLTRVGTFRILLPHGCHVNVAKTPKVRKSDGGSSRSRNKVG
ncbi:hypothetical protein M0804_014909 [Polistes exclamans]|nr:hypothetical protein M0804_014910 [Polistes exclamans]KAI4474329.1 hypothetical protein M0804_014909 [Polistes exclamans]